MRRITDLVGQTLLSVRHRQECLCHISSYRRIFGTMQAISTMPVIRQISTS